MTENNSDPVGPGSGIPAAPGRVVAGQYRLLRELGRGGMGVVWLAQDESLTRRVAVKELRPPSGLTGASVARLQQRGLREARNAACIRHPNAVALYKVIPPNADDDAVYLILEFVDGPTLAGLIVRHGPMPAPRVRAIGLQLLDVLQAAHALGIVHRDVKPGNILITPDGQAKLTDFGIAHAAGDSRLTTTDGIMGTLAYMAPELFRPGPPTPAADLWSLGATLYYAAEGRAPFDRDSVGATLCAILFDPLPSLDCDPEVAAAISRLLRRDPAERATVEQARAQLLGHGPVRFPAAGPPLPEPVTAAGPQPAVGAARTAIVAREAPPPPVGPGTAPPAKRRPPRRRLSGRRPIALSGHRALAGGMAGFLAAVAVTTGLLTTSPLVITAHGSASPTSLSVPGVPPYYMQYEDNGLVLYWASSPGPSARSSVVSVQPPS
jgi:hypothetical protein